MKILLSPAKTLSLDAPNANQQPRFDHDTESLRRSFKRMSLKRYMSFFNISKDVAKLTKAYYLSDTRYNAHLLYSGIAFRVFHQFEKTDVDNLYILSGLYGLIHANDGIKPYRLDLKHPVKGTLISFWKKRLYEVLKDEDVIYVCASSEYRALLDERLPLIDVIITNQEKKAPSVEAKKVRGALAHHLLKHKKADGFQFEGYRYTHQKESKIFIKK